MLRALSRVVLIDWRAEMKDIAGDQGQHTRTPPPARSQRKHVRTFTPAHTPARNLLLLLIPQRDPAGTRRLVSYAGLFSHANNNAESPLFVYEKVGA